jgi:ABC-type Mn2+/Zn2+ transport system permease subunit
MSPLLVAAAVLTFLVGLVHSLLGEALVFRRMRQGGVVPTDGGRVIGEGHVRIIWASWHALTVFGWCVAFVLLWLAQPAHEQARPALALGIAVAMLVGSGLVLFATRGRHPGWLGLLGVAALAWSATG